MKHLEKNKRIFTGIMALFMMFSITFSMFATEHGKMKKMESMPIKKVTTNSFDFTIKFITNNYVEEELTIKNWMLNPDTFIDDFNISDNYIEPALNIESWMTDINSFIVNNHTEPVLHIEPWMLDIKSFINTKK